MPRPLTVDVWVGLFASRERMEQYLEEIYDDDDSTPLSEFASDMDEFFYDHDFFESSFQESPTDDLTVALEPHSLPASSIVPVVEAFKVAPFSFNTIFLMWNEKDDFPQIETPVSVQKSGVELKYLGRFDGAMR